MRLRRWRAGKSQHMVSNRSFLFNLVCTSCESARQQERIVLKAAGQHAKAVLSYSLIVGQETQQETVEATDKVKVKQEVEDNGLQH